MVRLRGILLHTRIRSFSSGGICLTQNKFIFKESHLVNKVDRDKIPVSIIIGWAGSRDKNVSKYSDIYSSYGYHTIRMAPKIFFATFQAHKHKPCSKRLLDSIIDEYKLTENPLVFHMFSNVGPAIYRYLIEVSKNTKKYSFFNSNLKSIVFDSGPGYLVKRSVLMHSVTDVVYEVVRNKPLSYFITFFGLFLVRLYHETLPLHMRYFYKIQDGILKNQKGIPTLFFVTKNDGLIDFQTTWEFIERKKELLPQNMLDYVVFEDTEHVKHFQKHKEVYLDKLKRLMVTSNLPLYN